LAVTPGPRRARSSLALVCRTIAFAWKAAPTESIPRVPRKHTVNCVSPNEALGPPSSLGLVRYAVCSCRVVHSLLTVAVSFALCAGVGACGGGAPYGAEVTPHWEVVEEHDMYFVPDPRETGEDRKSRVRLVTLAEQREYTVCLINGFRRAKGRAALVPDEALNAFAQEASVRLSVDHRPHAHFESAARHCGCGAEAENQGSPHGWPPGAPDTQILEMLRGMLDEGPGGGHHDALLSPEWGRVGVGIVNPGGRMYFTTDFAR
jgi:hypothetical protein